MRAEPHVIELTEHGPARYFDRGRIPAEAAQVLVRSYDDNISLEYPSPKTNGRWVLAARGWVGYIPVSRDFGVSLKPKVRLSSLFAMLEWAYRLRSFMFLQGLTTCSTLAEFYQELANVLARRVLDRARKGLYRAYLQCEEDLPYIRGRIDIAAQLRRPSQLRVRCHYEEHTADVDVNRILAWALRTIARNAACGDRAMPSVRKAYRALRGLVLLTPCRAQDCLGHEYNRLNEDYRALHALCRFFLENTGPSHEAGDRSMLPFLVNMPRLFELFVAEWLREHLPAHLSLRAQDRAPIDLHVCFAIDLGVYDVATGKALCVVDTKYKVPESPSTGDVAQVVAYAEAKGCTEAVLVYPVRLQKPLDAAVGNIRVRTLTFPLDGDLDEAGEALLESLLRSACVPTPAPGDRRSSAFS